jgi:dTDP-glucose 4,6-dehydratase
MRKILITGGCGFIGSNFVRYWLGRRPDDRIVNLDNLTYAGNRANLRDAEAHPGYRFVLGDICDAALVQALIREERIDTIVHFAAESHVDRSILGPQEFIRTNVTGTFTLLDAARAVWKNGTEQNRFLHVSTDEVFGSLAPGDPPFSENHPYSPRSPYSASKAAADHLVRAYHHTYGLPALITNCSNNYGPYQFPEKLIPLAIRQAIKGEPIPVYGKGENVRDWVYVGDHCAALEAALEGGRIGETYNIGGQNQWTNFELVAYLCDLIDEKLGATTKPRRSLIRFVEDRPGHDLRYAMDISKISRELGWRPEESLQSGLAKTVDWYLSHREWVETAATREYEGYFDAQYGSRLRRPRCVLLDRDGTLIEERNYITDAGQVELIPGVAGALRRLKEIGLLAVVITNQSALGRGYLDEPGLNAIHDRLQALLGAQGVRLDAIYHCPHRPDDDCLCRKPRSGLVERAAGELGFDPGESFVIGDKACDIDMGRNVGATTLLVRTGYGAQVAADSAAQPDYVVNDLSAATEVIAQLLKKS